jgi:hypothetical protein
VHYGAAIDFMGIELVSESDKLQEKRIEVLWYGFL